MTTILTPRTTLREYRENDENAFVAYQTDPGFTRFHAHDELGDGHARDVFRLFLEWAREKPRQNYQLAIAPNEEQDQLIGSCGVRMQDCRDGEAVFGIELARAYWGRYKLAGEVGVAMIDWAFRHLPLKALVADTAFDNEVVARLARHAGFVQTHADTKQWWRLEREAWEPRQAWP